MATIEEFYGRDIRHREDFFRTATGDLETEAGLANMLNQLYRRLITVPGSIIHRPNYGVGIKQYQNVTLTLAVRQRIALAVKDNFETDPRVQEVTSVSFDTVATEAGKFRITVVVDLVGYGEQSVQFKPFEG